MDTDAVDRLRRVIARLGRHLNAESTSEGLTPSQASVLGQIAGRGPLGVRELADLEGLNPTMLSRVLGKLEESGLITRAPHPDDLRAAIVAATEQGIRVHHSIRDRRAASLSASIAAIDAAYARSLGEALPALEALAGALRERR